MSTVVTPRELLAQHPGQAPAGPTLGVEADVALEGVFLDKVVELLTDDESLVGLQVFSSEGEALGVISNDMLQDYFDIQADESDDRGGGLGRLEGDLVSDPPLFRCDAHQPATQQLIYYASPALLRCPTCGAQMKRAR